MWLEFSADKVIEFFHYNIIVILCFMLIKINIYLTIILRVIKGGILCAPEYRSLPPKGKVLSNEAKPRTKIFLSLSRFLQFTALLLLTFMVFSNQRNVLTDLKNVLFFKEVKLIRVHVNPNEIKYNGVSLFKFYHINRDNCWTMAPI
jgi:hypothetical protein